MKPLKPSSVGRMIFTSKLLQSCGTIPGVEGDFLYLMTEVIVVV